MRTSQLVLVVAAVVSLAFVATSPAFAGPTPQQQCQAAKDKAAGKYATCRQSVEAKLATSGDTVKYGEALTKCTSKFTSTWQKAIDKATKAGATCFDDPLTAGDFQTIIDEHTNNVATALGGGGLTDCPAALESCQNALAAFGTGCDAPLACPATDSGHQTICGQLYDLDDGARLQAMGATGTECTTTTADGPCSLNIVAYDALVFAMDPTTAPPLTAGSVYIDDCGRYRVSDIAIPSGPFIELAIDDADVAKHGPTGSTNTVGVSVPKQAGAATANRDGWVASKATTDLWESSGGPPVSGGLFIPLFHETVAPTSRDLQDGVTVTKSGGSVPPQDHYFVSTESARHTINPAATATGINGTALVTGASVSDGVVYSGSGGGLSSSCVWETHAGASLPFVLSVQDFRPRDAIGQTCDR